MQFISDITVAECSLERLSKRLQLLDLDVSDWLVTHLYVSCCGVDSFQLHMYHHV